MCLFFSLVCWVHICRSKSNSFHSIVDSYITICCHICMINDIFSPTYLVSLWFTFCLHFQFKSCLFSLSLVYILFAFSNQELEAKFPGVLMQKTRLITMQSYHFQRAMNLPITIIKPKEETLKTMRNHM